jgi:hypothetical protein
MEKPTAPEPSGDARTPLSFSLNQAAALCGVSAHELWEWTTCGYVRTTGLGEGRRYDREALRQILALRETVRSGHDPGSRSGAGDSDRPGFYGDSTRASEFSLPATAMDDTHLTLQTDMYFALNAGAGASAEDLAAHFEVDMEQMSRVLDRMVQGRHLVRIRQGSEIVFRSARTQLHGPSVREQRIRATRRPRVPSRPI